MKIKMRTFLIIFIPLEIFDSLCPLLYEDSYTDSSCSHSHPLPFSLHFHLDSPYSQHFHSDSSHSSTRSPHPHHSHRDSSHSHPDSPHFYHPFHSIPRFAIPDFTDSQLIVYAFRINLGIRHFPLYGLKVQ